MIARRTALANDSYVTVITLNRREPICIDLNKAFFTNPGKKPEEGRRARCAGHQKMGKNGGVQIGYWRYSALTRSAQLATHACLSLRTLG